MADITMEKLLAEKKQANQQAMNEAISIRNAIDENGKVKIWLIAEKKWVKVWPIDAMGILKSGSANLTGPEEEKTEIGTENTPVEIDFAKYDDEALLGFAAQAGIPGTVKKRETLITKLSEMGFVPEK